MRANKSVYFFFLVILPFKAMAQIISIPSDPEGKHKNEKTITQKPKMGKNKIRIRVPAKTASTLENCKDNEEITIEPGEKNINEAQQPCQDAAHTTSSNITDEYDRPSKNIDLEEFESNKTISGKSTLR